MMLNRHHARTRTVREEVSDAIMRCGPHGRLARALGFMDADLRELSQSEYEASFSPPMRDVTQTAEEIVDLWPYAERALKATFSDACTCDFNVGYVYESADKAYQHILIPSHISNVYLVVVISRARRAIVGHHRLDLGALYGLHEA